MKKLIHHSILAVLLLVSVTTALPATKNARDTVWPLFDRYDLVALPEIHRSKEVHEFLRSMVRDRRLAAHGVTNIVVEFGNANYQNTADRYVRGDDVPFAEVQKIWRDTTQFLVWDSPLYEEFFRTVRETNASLPRDKKIRVVLGDPPIGWEIIHTKADYERYADRDLFYADAVEREVLNKGQKALLISGRMHFINAREPAKQEPDRKRSAADLLHRRHPGKLFAFWNTASPIGDVQCASTCALVVRGSRFEKESFALFAPEGILIMKTVDGEKRWVPLESSDWPTVAEMTETGLIYYGAGATTVDPAAGVYQDQAYVKELRRRAAILSEVYGMDFGKSLDEVLAPSGQ